MVHNQQLHAVCFNSWGFSMGIMIDRDDVSHSACHHATDGLLVQHFWRSDVVFFRQKILSIRRVPFCQFTVQSLCENRENQQEFSRHVWHVEFSQENIPADFHHMFPMFSRISPLEFGELSQLPWLPSGGSLQGILQLRLSLCLSGRSPWNCGFPKLKPWSPKAGDRLVARLVNDWICGIEIVYPLVN